MYYFELTYFENELKMQQIISCLFSCFIILWGSTTLGVIGGFIFLLAQTNAQNQNEDYSHFLHLISLLSGAGIGFLSGLIICFIYLIKKAGDTTATKSG